MKGREGAGPGVARHIPGESGETVAGVRSEELGKLRPTGLEVR